MSEYFINSIAMNVCKILVIDDEDDVEIMANAFLQSGVDAVHFVKTANSRIQVLDSPRLVT